MLEADSSARRGWIRAAGLICASVVLSVVNVGLLVSVPFAFLVLFLPCRRWVALATGFFVTGLAVMGPTSSGLWYMERGWVLVLSGWFLALTLRWPESGFLSRGLGAVTGSFGAMGLLFWSRPGAWAVADWAMTSRMEATMAIALQAVHFSLGPEAVQGMVEVGLIETIAIQGYLFPALLGLASLASLGVAWWLYLRMAQAEAGGIGPFREFRFHDQLVWVLILGLLFFLGSGGLLDRVGVDLARAGTNAAVFMGALYALRGAAVVLFLTGGVSFLGGVLLLFGFFFMAPLLLAGAFIMGLGDTWLDLRARRTSVFQPRA